MDSGGHFPDQVIRFCKEREERHIWPIKGRGGMDVPYLRNPTKNNRVGGELFTLGVDTGKNHVLARLKVLIKGPNYCHFPAAEDAGYDENYFKMLTAEHKVTRWKSGRKVERWELKDPAQKRNEAFDVRNYAIRIEKWKKEGMRTREIAEKLRVDPSTVYRELKRGSYDRLNGTTWELIPTYSPDIAEQKYQAHLREKGPNLKIGKDHELAAYIERTIIDKDCSPAAVYGYAQEEGKTFKTHISVPTIYSYIKKGVFLNVTQGNGLLKSHAGGNRSNRKLDQ